MRRVGGAGEGSAAGPGGGTLMPAPYPRRFAALRGVGQRGPGGSVDGMRLEHSYAIELTWTGDRGTGTSGYRAYGRDHEVRAAGKHPIAGSSDRVFHGDVDRWNPEEMLVAALAQCHLLSYLHVAQAHGVVVVGYDDAATGVLEQSADGGGRITSVTLRPRVRIAAGDATLATSLHAEAAAKCFIAASVAFPVHHEPETTVEVPDAAADRSPSGAGRGVG